MPWRNATQLHIFVPTDHPYGYDNWVEQLLGSVLRPLFDDYGEALLWVFLTRHITARGMGDDVPERYFHGGMCRYVTLRISVAEDQRVEIMGLLTMLATGANCYITIPKRYDVLAELGSNRFVRPEADDTARAARAHLLVTLLDAMTRLMLDTLVQDERGVWVQEPNDELEQNPKGSLFESVHHLFCNATGVPLDVLLMREGNTLKLSTYWMSTASSTSLRDDDDFSARLSLEY